MSVINCFTNVDTVLIKLKDGSLCTIFSNTSTTPVTPSLSTEDKREVVNCICSCTKSACSGVPYCPVNFTQTINDDCGKRANASYPTNRVTYKLPEPYASKLEACWGSCGGTLLFDAQYTIYCCAYSRYPDKKILVHAFNCYMMDAAPKNCDSYDKFFSCTMFSYSGLKSPSYSSCLPTSYSAFSSTIFVGNCSYRRCFPLIAVVRTGPGDYYIWPGPNLTDFKIDNIAVY